jgi:uncharacterized membrane protein YfcA
VLGLSGGVVAALVVALVVGAAVQGTIGLGLGLVAAPVAALVAPEAVPELLLWLALVMAATTLVHEHRGVDWDGLLWAVPARVLGTALGVAVVAALTPNEIGIAVALMVLVAVALTARTVEVPITRVTLPVAGFVSGVSGTATSIGGPPLALLYQHRHPSVVRPTLAAYFVIGAGMSLAGLGLAGELHTRFVWLSLWLSPCLIAGFLLAVPLRSRLPVAVVRRAILGVCAASALVLLLRSIWA